MSSPSTVSSHGRSAAGPVIPLSVRVLRRLRPLVTAIVSSPLHGLLSGDILILEYRGRRSGRRYSLPLSYVEGDGGLYLCTRPQGSKWWRNLIDEADVRVRLRGRDRAARARVLDSGSAEALDGLRTFLTRNPGTGRLLYGVDGDRRKGPDETDLAREVLASVVVRVDVEGGRGART